MRVRAIVLVVSVFACIGAPWPAAGQRLADDVAPTHYSLWFGPDLEKETFRGRAAIRVDVRKPTNAITLHAAELEFNDVTVAAGGRTQTAIVKLNPRDETATLTVADELPAGDATLRITYTGILNDKLRGFYVSRANGRKYAVSQMEATDARRAFPSFDEPRFKATFDVVLMVDANDTAISNGAQLSDIPGPEPGKHTLAFATTPKMSTYLVALMVGDFVCRPGGAAGTVIRVCATADKVGLTGFALDAAQQQLQFFNDYFGIPYAFGKLDLIAVPDFAAGAMENSGAITFRERLLLVDPERASLATRKNVAAIISHEIAHQWFGNLVTMKWWDDIWLNEGFATWIANKPLAQWRPEWKVELDDAADTQTALGIDALRTTRPIRIHVETPDEINEVFDGIAYEKTAGVLRMVEAFVGPDLFRKGIAAYLRKYAFSNAAGEDFWTEMTRVTGRPIDRILRGYVEQAGAPALKVDARCVGSSTELSAEQERFIGIPGARARSSELWTVPVCFESAGGSASCEVLDERRERFRAPACGTVFANADGRGYYFTEYAPDMVRSLGARPDALSPVERLGLLGDEWWMVRAGRHDIGLYLNLGATMAADPTAAVTDAVASRIAYTSEYLVRPSSAPVFQRWVRARFGPALDALGIPGDVRDDDERHSRRATLLTLVAGPGNDAALQRRARELAERYITDPSTMPGTLVSAVLRTAAAAGDAVLYGRYLEQMRKPGIEPEEYYRFFGALPSFQDPELVRRTLVYSISPDVRSQDTATLLAGLLGQPGSRPTAWAFVKAQWPTLREKLGTFQGLPAIIGAAGNFCSQKDAADVKQFFAQNPVPSSERTLQQALERIDACEAVVKRQLPALTTWLSETPALDQGNWAK